MKELKNRAVIYCRVSTEKQADKGLSIAVQEKLCRETAVKDGFRVVEVIRDEGKSGGNLQRPGIKRLKELISGDEVDAVYMVHSDRLSRNIVDHFEMRDFFAKHNVERRLVHLTGIDLNTASGETMDNIIAVISEYQRKATAEKTKDALNAKVQEGWFPGLAPLGYNNVYNPKFRNGEISRKIIAKDDEVARFITLAFKMYATGNYNGLELNDLLYKKGLRTKRNNKLQPSKFYEMLANPIYRGIVRWGDIETIGKHTPLIDQATFDRVQSVLAAHSNFSNRRRKHFFLLRGLVKCSRHKDRRYTAEQHPKKTVVLSYYHCTQRGGCKGSYVRTDYLEDEVKQLFKGLSFSKSFTERVIRSAQKKFEAYRKDHVKRIKTLDSQRKKLLSRKSIVENKLFEGVISDEEFNRINSKIKTDIAVISEEISRLSESRELHIDVAREVLRFTKDVHTSYTKASLITKRHYLNLFIKEIYVSDGQIDEVIYSDLFQVLSEMRALGAKKSNVNEDIGIKEVKRGA